METSLSVGNDAVLRSARRWIIGAYVWQIITALYKFASPYIVNVIADYDTIHVLNKFHGVFFVFCNFVFLLVLSIGVLKLRKHSLPRFRIFANLIIVVTGVFIVVSVVYDLLPVLIGSISQPVTCYIFLFLAVFRGYLLCMAYACLLKDKAIEAIYRYAIAVLCLAAFVQTASSSSWHILALALDYDFMNAPIRIQMFMNGTYYMFLIIFIIACIANILGYKYLFATPSNIPAAEDVPATFSFRPSKIEIGFIVSAVLLVILICVSVKTILV